MLPNNNLMKWKQSSNPSQRKRNAMEFPKQRENGVSIDNWFESCIDLGIVLNDFVQHYEPLFYDEKDVHHQLKRSKRESDADVLLFRFNAHNRCRISPAPSIHSSFHPYPFPTNYHLTSFLCYFHHLTLHGLASEIQVAMPTANNLERKQSANHYSCIPIKTQSTTLFHSIFMPSSLSCFRLFKIRLRRSANDVFADDVQMESSTGPIYYNMNNIYHGQMEGNFHN